MSKQLSRPSAGPASGAELLRVGELADRTGKTNRALWFYEELDLLRPVRRTKGGFRLYDPSAVLRVYWIDRLQELGFSLSEIRDFMESLREQDTGPAAMHQLRMFYARKLVETREAVRRLQGLEGELGDSLAYLQSCETCRPDTPRSACPSCTEMHRDVAVPAMVAAVHEPA